jgi:hypothetical protein
MPINTPAPVQPQLESVSLRGQRVCGQFDISTANFNFVCDPLPTIGATGWQLTPLEKPHPSDPNLSLTNRGIAFTVSGPTLTSIEVAYIAASGSRFVMAQVSPGLDRPRMLQAGPSEVEVAATDDGVRKTWTIAAKTNSCFERQTLEIVNFSSRGRSNPLIIDILRSPGETFCIQDYQNPPGPPGGGSDGKVGMGETPVTSPPSACPGGAPLTTFRFCEVCSTAPRASVQYTAIESCSLSSAEAAMGYGPNGPKLGGLCSLRQTGGQAQCEGR